MLRCTRQGCGQDYDPATNTNSSCSFHPGAPVFHEGLKSWSCCADVNKPVLDFDEFMKLPGCHEGPHTNEAPKTESTKPTKTTSNVPMATTESGSETFTVKQALAPSPTVKANTITSTTSATPAPPPEEEDDPSVPAPVGTKCRRLGCNILFESDTVNRHESGSGAVCVYHPKSPIFHEGSKGYLCCKPRVLEFEEFLKIKGCATGRHVFVPKTSATQGVEVLTECRVDHYQTPAEVHVSVFAKKADQQRSTVTIEETRLHLDLYLPDSKRFSRTIELFGPVDSAASSHKFYGTKVEVVLRKQDTRSWTILEKPAHDLGPVALTFGVSGRTGTIGAKELILDADNQIKRT